MGVPPNEVQGGEGEGTSVAGAPGLTGTRCLSAGKDLELVDEAWHSHRLIVKVELFPSAARDIVGRAVLLVTAASFPIWGTDK